MSDTALSMLTLPAALGCGLMAGVFFIFSTAIMRVLGRMAPAAGIAGMQAINRGILNPLFLGLFLATAAACAALMIAAPLRWSLPGAGWALLGGGLYMLGCFGITMLCNVPLNNRLAALEPCEPRAATAWASYLRNWTLWNHVRTVASLMAAAALMIAFGAWGAQG